MTSTKIVGKMPLTQEKRLDTNFSNNNDHSYLHKKFKKMASTISVFPSNLTKVGDTRQKEVNVSQIECNVSIPNGSIAAAHPEIEKIKGKNDRDPLDIQALGKNVQTNFNDENSRLSNVNNIQVSGQTSFTDEFLNKTEIQENDFIKESYNGTPGGRYICPYCKLPCAKPSVLQKHIRAHTNERPYPCVPCGFAFKTKSNLYKHRRSRTHALRLQGGDVSVTLNEEDMSGGSESDTPTSVSETGSDVSSIRFDNFENNKFSPDTQELLSESPNITSQNPISTSLDSIQSKSIYKPKFRVGTSFYRDSDDKEKFKKSISPNADFLTEHISKIISDNEAIVDVIETPLQKKYSKIKQIAESKQFMSEIVEIKSEPSPLNLTKNNNQDFDNSFRKRSHSESFSQSDLNKHPLNPEGSIIKDLLLKTKMNGLAPVTGELLEGPLFICPLCQIIYRSADNLETHRLYYCKGSISNNNASNERKDIKIGRHDNIFLRSNSVNVRLPETSSTSPIQRQTSSTKSTSNRIKPNNLIIMKPESGDIIAPLPSPGPLLGNTRLVDTRMPSDFSRKSEALKLKLVASPKRRIECSSDMYSPRLLENMSPRSSEIYSQSKIRCIDTNSGTFRPIEEMSPHMRNNSTSLQMFGGEVKIMDHSGSTTTLRIEPNKNQLSPILIQQNLSPSKLVNDTEASSIVVRSGLHSGGTIMHNPPTPKEILGNSQPQTPRISISTPSIIPSSNLPNIHNITTHFQFPPLSAITAFNPLTLPPLSPSSSPSGATQIFHGGKLIPHVPGIPGPNTPGMFVTNASRSPKSLNNDINRNCTQLNREDSHTNLVFSQSPQMVTTYETHQVSKSKSPNLRLLNTEAEKQIQSRDACNSETQQYAPSIPIIKIKNVDEPKIYTSNIGKQIFRQDMPVKRNSEGIPRTPVLKENFNYAHNKLKNKDRQISNLLSKNKDTRTEKELRNFNFENLITKAEIYNNQIPNSSDVQKNKSSQDAQTITIQNERSETSYFQKNITAKTDSEERKPKFLRPTTLPLKPGTFTPKRHHGITPNANTMPLVSPETPRPAKAYGQLYLNGNAYTYLGLKCSTKVFYCTINRPQPTYVPNQHFLSMYSNWQLLSELTPDPLGLSASSAMSLYDSRHRPQNISLAMIKQDLILTHSSQWNKGANEYKQTKSALDVKKVEDNSLQLSDNLTTPKKELTGGFESNEEYTYVRGRGRGRYVCSECGIRCKKPSMLKKHIRTHTDVRPYTCIHCAFSFKTKGNLTKHMKSKAHYKKCCELGINPNEGNYVETGESAQCSGETDDDTDSDGDEGNEGETESSDTEIFKSRLPEHEAAHCLLSLGGPRPTTSATPGLITSARPTTYPYTPADLDSLLIESSEKMTSARCPSAELRMDVECEPIDLSKTEMKTLNIPEIPTARESSVLASLASNTAKLPQAPTQWTNGEPMLHTYLTERALLDSKIKQSQLTSSSSKSKSISLNEKYNLEDIKEDIPIKKSVVISVPSSQAFINDLNNSNTTVTENDMNKKPIASKDDNSIRDKESPVSICNNTISDSKRVNTQCNKNAENAKHVVSEYLKHARINHVKTQDDSIQNQNENINDTTDSNNIKSNGEENINPDDLNNTESDTMKLLSMDHDPIATKVVIGVGGVAFKVTKGKDFENSSYSPGRLMEDGRRVCDFCNKTFTKPSQLRLHLNIHYMERPFRCGVCAVSFRTRGHLQKHERSGSHHNKVSMTSTFGAATSFNPRPFRCSDCNIAFRIHGHLAKHLRSKMHVMRLECLFKLPFGTFTEIERAGVSLTDIDTTDCASSLASLQTLARKLHDKDPTKLEYRDPNSIVPQMLPAGREHSEDEDTLCDNLGDCEKDTDSKTIENSEEQDIPESRGNCSATDI